MTHPGDVLHEALKSAGIVQSHFASQIGVGRSFLSDFLMGKRRVSVRMALRLESIMDQPAEYWLNLQMIHDLALARAAAKKRK